MKKTLEAKSRTWFKNGVTYRMHNKKFATVKMRDDIYAIIFTRVLNQFEANQVTDEMITKQTNDDMRQYFRRCGITIAVTYLYLTEEGLIFLAAITQDTIVNLHVLDDYEHIINTK